MIECDWCGNEFVQGRNRKCCSKECSDELKSARDRTNKYKPRPVKRCKCCNKVLTRVQQEFCSTICDKRWRRFPIPRVEPLNSQGFRKRMLPGSDEFDAMQNALAERNALQAWRHWMDIAPSTWLDQYWKASVTPWEDRRLNNTERYRIRYCNDVSFQIKERIRRQVTKKAKRDGVAELMRGAINRNGKSNRVEELLGYSIEELKAHLEKQFTRGMTWEKFRNAEIHIDHIVPQSAFDLSDDDQWRKCWCLSNLMPLWSRDNLKKSNASIFLL